jgi:hypothetical protein
MPRTRGSTRVVTSPRFRAGYRRGSPGSRRNPRWSVPTWSRKPGQRRDRRYIQHPLHYHPNAGK